MKYAPVSSSQWLSMLLIVNFRPSEYNNFYSKDYHIFWLKAMYSNR